MSRGSRLDRLAEGYRGGDCKGEVEWEKISGVMIVFLVVWCWVWL